MKVILEFNLPEESEEYELALRGSRLHAALHEIAQEVFRPARKHGYADAELQALVDLSENSVELIGMLEKKFYEILKERDIEL